MSTWDMMSADDREASGKGYDRAPSQKIDTETMPPANTTYPRPSPKITATIPGQTNEGDPFSHAIDGSNPQPEQGISTKPLFEGKLLPPAIHRPDISSMTPKAGEKCPYCGSNNRQSCGC